MKNFFRKLSSVEGDPIKQVIDLLIFLAYFSISFYAGGFAYSLNYFSQLGIEPSLVFEHYQFITIFILKVILDNWIIAILSIILIFLYVIIYYYSKYIWKPWLGLIIFIIIFYVTTISAILCGFYFGKKNVIRDYLSKTTTAPIVKVKGSELNKIPKFSGGKYHLILQTEKDIYIFKPEESKESIGETVVIPMKEVHFIEIQIHPINGDK